MKRDTSVLIITAPHDDHSPPVIWALKQAGITPLVWDWRQYPGSSQVSNFIDSVDSKCDWEMVAEQRFSKIDTLWYRRLGRIRAHPNVHSADEHFVQIQAAAHVAGVLNSLKISRWVNHPTAARLVETKLPQLHAARAAGFCIPDTLVSNSPDAVSEFRNRHQGSIIMKPFKPFRWRDGSGRDHLLQTARITKDARLDPAQVELCPNIFQAEIQKKYELRITIFGDEGAALKIDSQAFSDSVDWRLDQSLGLAPTSIVELDRDLQERCLDVCRRLNISFGAFDIVVDRNGQTYFLEVNQAGQFLFFDSPELNPKGRKGCAMLERFCAFLVGGDASADDFPSYAEYFSSGADELRRNDMDLNPPRTEDQYYAVE